MSTPFQFKQFTVLQESAPFKVGTDGVLLGAWVCKKKPLHILDIGTGTGLIALMLAQRFSLAHIDAIEINKQAHDQASKNFKNSPWNSRIHLHNTSLQNYTPKGSFDMVVCNPPFFIASLKSGKEGKDQARHSESLQIHEIFKFSTQNLKEGGSVSLILPADQLSRTTELAESYELNLSWICEVFPAPESKIKRILLEFRKEKRELRIDQLVIETGSRHAYSDEFKAITKEFYLAH